MRDWLVTDQADRNLLVAVQQASDGWLPWRGSFARANRLRRNGLVQKAGTAAMPPHVLYVLTDKGREEIEVAARLAKS
jgi:hypothetical protein